MSAIGGDVQRISVELVLPGESPRLAGEDVEHAQALADSGAVLPPILVHRATMRVIDGAHRLLAARLRGDETVEVRFFDGDEDDVFVAAVRANVAHGLPLTLADRQAAAARILASHPHWSDRSITAVTGLAPRTVAEIRRRVGTDGPGAGARTGRDGRVRPLSTADARRLASATIAERPDASLREIARIAGVSPTTVRDVRDRMRRGEDPVPAGQAAAERRRSAGPDRATLMRNLGKDPSLRLTESGRVVLRWLFARAGGPSGGQELMDSIPPHSAYTVAALARACAREWLEFADELESRLRPGR